MNGNHINYRMTVPFFRSCDKNFLCFIRANKVVSENPFDRLDTGFNHFFVIGATILSQQKFQNIYRDISSFLDFLG